MIVYYDRQFVCRFANSQYATFFGFTEEGILGKHLSEIIGAQSYAKHGGSVPARHRRRVGDV